MPKFVSTSPETDCLYATFGKLGKGQEADKSYLVKEGEYIQGVVSEIKDSSKYKKIYTLEVKGVEKPVVILGKTDLINQMGHGKEPTEVVVKEGDLVRVTFINKTTTQKGYDWYNFEVAVAQSD